MAHSASARYLFGSLEAGLQDWQSEQLVLLLLQGKLSAPVKAVWCIAMYYHAGVTWSVAVNCMIQIIPLYVHSTHVGK